MTYTYNENNGESTIQKIDYTFNSLQNITSYASIEFEYVNRVFPQQFFISNVMIVQTQILCKIKVKYLNTEIRRYEFIYDNNAYPQRLKEIKYFGSNNEELKSTEIEWGATTQNFTTQGIGVPNNQYQTNYFTWFKGDFNGDGIDDLISILQNTTDHDANTGNDVNRDYLRLHLFDLNGYMNNVSGRGCDFDNLEERWVRVADIDGDGKDELIVIYNEAPNRRLVAYSYVQGVGLMIKANNIVSNNSDMSIQSGDFNGDGKADVVLINRQHGSGQNPNCWLMNFDEYISTFSQIAQGTMHNVDPNITFTMDFNGNGKTDILVCNDATTKIYEFDNNGVLSIIYSSGYPTKWHDVYPGDFNGDGKTDLLSWDHVSYKLSINYSTGLGFDGPHYLNFLGTFSAKPSDDAWDHNIYIADYNLDGLSDILIADQNTCGETFHFWLSRGNDNFQLEYTLNGGVKFRYDAAVVGDFDGDLNLELFTHKTNDIWYDGSCQQNSNGKEINLFRTLNCSQRSLAQKITNGYGKETHFSYKTLSKLSEPPYIGKYEKGSGAVFPVFDYQGTMQVVNSMWESDLSGQTIVNRYYFFYQGAKIHRQGRGFLCFERILTNNNNLNLSKKTEYDYDTDYYYSFITETSASPIGQNDMSSTVLTNNRQTYSNGVFWPYVSRTIANDYLTGVTNATDNNYNVDGNLESLSQKISGTPAGDITINAEYNYSHFGNPTNTIPNRMTFHKTTSVYPGNDAYIYETTFDYDGNGNLTDKMENPNQNLSQSLHTRYVYNNFCGKANSIEVTGTNFDGTPMTTRTTSYDYGNSNFRFVNTATNPAGQLNYSDYDISTGNVLRQVNEGGLETSFLYDEFGRLTQINSPRVLASAGTSQPLLPDEIIYEWDNQGTIAGSVYKITRTGDNKPATVEYYDSFNRLLRSSVQKMENVNSIKYVCTDRQYEQGTGRLQSQSKPYYTNSSPQWLVYNYSSVDGRLMSETDQQTNNVTSYKYSGLSVETTFADGNKKTIYKDAIENVIITKENGVKMTYDYNSMFKLKRMESDYSNTSMEYDDWGNNVQLNDCDAGTSNYKYDALSQLREQEDANGVKYEMSYNLLGQVISKTELNQTAQAITNYTYINSGPGINKPATIQKGNDVIQYTYYGSTGELGDLRTTIRTNNSQSFSYNYDYYKNGNLKRKQFPSGFKVEYHYNTIGSLIEMKGDDGTSINTLWSNPTENALGQPLSFNFGQLSQNVNLQKQYTYDNNNYPSVIKTQNILSSTAIWQENYTFDAANGNLKERTSMYNLQEKFSYDNFNQLQSATGPTSFSITYGADGNINQKTGVGDYTYIANKHAIEDLKNYPVPEPVSTHKQDIAYTAFNKASQITEGDYEYNIAYAADDERFKTELINTQTNTTEQIKYYAGDYEEFRDASNNVMRRLHYINSPYGLVAVVEKTPATQYNTRYITTDYLGSIVCITDDAGNVLQQVSFDAWGRRRDPQTWALYQANAPLTPTPSALYFGRGYTGHEHLEKFDLINMNGRMYDPTLCRMLSVDNYNNNVSSTIGMNRYAYALNNPLKYTDPSGQWVHIVIGAAVGGVINLGIKAYQGKIHSWGDGFVAFGIGAAAGALGALTGGAAFAAAGGGAAGAGGFAAGAAGGAAGAAVSMPVMSIGNSNYFGDPKMTAKEYFIGILVGGVLGGVTNGITALANGGKFLDGTPKSVGEYTMATSIPTKSIPNDLPEMDIIKQDMPNSISKMEQQTLYKVQGRDGISYENATLGNSIPNKSVDISASQMSDKLIQAGGEKTLINGGYRIDLNGTRYVFYNRGSTGSAGVSIQINGLTIQKYLLNGW